MTPDDKPNAPMTPREYVELIVLPTLHELLAARDDRRRAYLACLVVCHVADSIGLAEAAGDPGFAALSNRKRRDAVEVATKAVQAEARRRCGGVFEALHGIANGVKHPGRLPLLPGSERHVPAFAADTPGSGADEGRIDIPGLALDVDGETLFLDVCAQQVLAVLISTYPQHFGTVDLSFVDRGLPIPGLAMHPAWPGGIAAWASRTPAIAEVWLFGSRAKGTAQRDSDVDLGLVLSAGKPDQDWPAGDYCSLGDRWQVTLSETVCRHVSLELFSRPGEERSEEEAAARADAILLWKRPASAAVDPASSSSGRR